jgi:single-strand DNA-binding protein
MSSAGLNKWIVSGNLAADVQTKTVELKNGEQAQVANATLYVRKPRSREESFTVSLSIWEKSLAWRKLQFLKKGALIICTGSVEPNPYVTKSNNAVRMGLEMTVIDIDLDIIPREESADEELAQTEMAPAPAPVVAAAPAPVAPAPVAKSPITAEKPAADAAAVARSGKKAEKSEKTGVA